MNPYSDTTFFSFFKVFIERTLTLFQGGLFPDEVQLLALSGIGVTASLVGTFLVFRKMTMLANALSHTLLIGIVGVYLFSTYILGETDFGEKMGLGRLLIASLFIGFITTFLTEFLRKKVKLQEDASIGLVFSSLFALGLLLLTLFSRNAHLGTELLFGNVDALKKEDLGTIFFLLGVNLLFFSLFFKHFMVSTFDPGFAASSGISPSFFNYMLMVLTAATAMGAFKAVGVLMVLAFFVGPVLIGRPFARSLKSLIIVSSIIGVSVSFLGVALSRHLLTTLGFGLSTAGVVIALLLIMYGMILVFRTLTFSPSSLYFSK